MSLQPNAIELFQSSALRGRRRSSIRPQNLLPLLFANGGPPPNQNESAVADDVCTPDITSTDETSATLTPISPLCDAHVSGHSSSFITSRHHDALSTHKSLETPSDSVVSGGSYFELRSPPTYPRVKWRLASTLFLYFLNGWGDGVTGTALPYFRAKFHLTYMTSSLLFVGTMCGFTAGALLVPHIMRFLSRFYLSNPKLALFSPFRIAFSKPSPSDIGHSASQARYLVVILGSFGAPTTFVLMGSQTGLPTMFLAYVVVSFGRAVLTAPLNMFLSKLPNRPLGYAYASWGFGAVVSPLVFQVTAAAGLPWAHFYFGSLVIAATSLTFLGITFMPTGREFAMDRKHALDEANSRSKCSPPLTPDSDDLHESDVSSDSLSHLQSIPTGQLRLVVFMPSLWAVSLFAILYCGSETTTQGLIVQYLLAERSANPNTVGYVTAGFWAGISVSRLAWSFFSPKFSYTGRKYIVQGCLALAFAMQLFIWFIDSNIENAVSCSLIGVFFGPMWPAILELTNDLLPVEVKLISMAIVSAAGSLGSAIFPFITGVVVTKYSMRCWSYITVSQVALLFIGWFLFPTAQPPRRSIAQ